MLEVKNLYAGYGGAIKNCGAIKDCTDVICNITFKMEKGESLCILGPNGSGKSTLLKSIARIIDYRGSVLMNGEDIRGVSRKELAKKIALLTQSTQVFFPYTVYETVSMGRYAYSQDFLKNLSAELDIWDNKDCMIDELSGGELQRVFLARTLAQNPDLILLDEPSNHLDLKHQIELLKFLKAWVKENDKTLISVFHDLNLARLFGDTAVVLNNGTLAASGKIDDVLNSGILSDVYGVDIRGFMRESLEKWK
jgi:iron complex transport system ATP-binding protein